MLQALPLRTRTPAALCYNTGVRAAEPPTALIPVFEETWQPQDLTDAIYVGVLEVPVAEGGDAPYFEVFGTANSLVFGNFTNSLFLQSGYMVLDPDEGRDAGLQELIHDLEVFYTDGPKYVSRIVVNERM